MLRLSQLRSQLLSNNSQSTNLTKDNMQPKDKKLSKSTYSNFIYEEKNSFTVHTYKEFSLRKFIGIDNEETLDFLSVFFEERATQSSTFNKLLHMIDFISTDNHISKENIRVLADLYHFIPYNQTINNGAGLFILYHKNTQCGMFSFKINNLNYLSPTIYIDDNYLTSNIGAEFGYGFAKYLFDNSLIYDVTKEILTTYDVNNKSAHLMMMKLNKRFTYDIFNHIGKIEMKMPDGSKSICEAYITNYLLYKNSVNKRLQEKKSFFCLLKERKELSIKKPI